MTDLYQKLIRPLVFRMDAEDAHELVCGLLSWIENFPSFKKFIEIMVSAPKDKVSVFGLQFPNTLGLAAGFDKNGRFPGICSSLGFGHVEVVHLLLITTHCTYLCFGILFLSYLF